MEKKPHIGRQTLRDLLSAPGPGVWISLFTKNTKP